MFTVCTMHRTDAKGRNVAAAYIVIVDVKHNTEYTTVLKISDLSIIGQFLETIMARAENIKGVAHLNEFSSNPGILFSNSCTLEAEDTMQARYRKTAKYPFAKPMYFDQLCG